jgi:putative phosphoesterase
MKENNLILIAGDCGTSSIPEEIKTILDQKKAKFDYVLLTNLISDQNDFDFIKSLLRDKNNIHMTQTETTLKIGDFIISLVNGHNLIPWGDIEVLGSIQSKTRCDILVSGSTCTSDIYNYEGKCLVNPGSITGAFHVLNKETPNPPSFIILIINSEAAAFYSYKLNLSTKVFDILKYEYNKTK